MSFRIADCKTPLLACLLFGLLPIVEAQSPSPGRAQSIVFSSPDGQTTSNAPIPMVQAPEGRQSPNLPAGEVAIRDITEPMVGPMYPQPLPVLRQPDAQNQDDFRGSMDVRKQMGVLTPGQIMNVPTAEQIFGLPEKKAADRRKEPWQLDNEIGVTNNPTFATNSMFAEPSWAKLWTENSGKGSESSNTTERASGFFSRFFDSGQNDNGFGNHNASGEETLFGPSQSAPQQQSSWDSGLAAGGLTPSPSPTAASASGFASPGSSPGLTSQSPFTPPHVSTLDTMPKLPSLPSLSGQNGLLTQPASTPTWAPKPPPWTQSQTPFRTPAPVNPALQR